MDKNNIKDTKFEETFDFLLKNTNDSSHDEKIINEEWSALLSQADKSFNNSRSSVKTHRLKILSLVAICSALFFTPFFIYNSITNKSITNYSDYFNVNNIFSGVKIISDDTVLIDVQDLFLSIDKDGVIKYLQGSHSFSLNCKNEDISFVTGVNSKVELTLPDLSRVSVNSSGVLYIPERTNSDYRKVYLKGEGFFNITKKPENPFLVSLENDVEVRVYGTSFNIISKIDNQKVTLLNGVVNVSIENKQEVELKPNQQLTIHQGNVNIETVEGWKSILWDRPYIETKNFKDNADLLNFLEERYSICIVNKYLIENKSLKGKISLPKSVKEMMSILSACFNVNIRQVDETNYIMVIN